MTAFSAMSSADANLPGELFKVALTCFPATPGWSSLVAGAVDDVFLSPPPHPSSRRTRPTVGIAASRFSATTASLIHTGASRAAGCGSSRFGRKAALPDHTSASRFARHCSRVLIVSFASSSANSGVGCQCRPRRVLLCMESSALHGILRGRCRDETSTERATRCAPSPAVHLGQAPQRCEICSELAHEPAHERRTPPKGRSSFRSFWAVPSSVLTRSVASGLPSWWVAPSSSAAPWSSEAPSSVGGGVVGTARGCRRGRDAPEPRRHPRPASSPLACPACGRWSPGYAGHQADRHPHRRRSRRSQPRRLPRPRARP